MRAPLSAVLSTLIGCTAAADDAKPSPSPCSEGDRRCEGSSLLLCTSGGWQEQPCGALGCDAELGCVACTPGQHWCEGEVIMACADDGVPHPESICDASEGLECAAGTCVSACELAAASKSYLGCEYWPTVTANPAVGISYGDKFHFAVVVGNPQKVPVTVTVELDDGEISRVLEPGEVGKLELPWVPWLRQHAYVDGFETPRSVRVPRGAYHLTSTMPVSAYQFNPIEFQPGSGVCSEYNPDNPCSYSGDASLLLPTSALTGRYRVMAWPTYSLGGGGPASPVPGFYTVVATADDTQVTVTSSAHTLAGDGVPAMSPGETRTFALDRGDALQVFSEIAFTPAECTPSGPFEGCTGGADYDVTGTLIEADQPVAVFGGHACAFVPYYTFACDHLEEQMFPLETWGRSVIGASTEGAAAGLPNVWRVLAAEDDTTVTFEPPDVPEVTLAAGEFAEFTLEGSFQATATGPILVAQFMVGQEYAGNEQASYLTDPSMGLVIPVEQHRASYEFLAPPNYWKTFADVIAPAGSVLELDSMSSIELVPIGGTSFARGRIELGEGAHHLESASGDVRFGVVVYGNAPWTSYLFPGGLDLVDISSPK